MDAGQSSYEPKKVGRILTGFHDLSDGPKNVSIRLAKTNQIESGRKTGTVGCGASGRIRRYRLGGVDPQGTAEMGQYLCFQSVTSGTSPFLL